MGKLRHRALIRSFVVLLAITVIAPQSPVAPAPVRASTRQPEAPRGERVPLNAPGTYRSSSTAASAPITSIVVTKPAGVTTNDVLLAAINVDQTPTITPPAGWTLVRSDVNGTIQTLAIYWRAAGGSEPASYTFTFGAAVNAATAGIVAYSGVDTTTPIDVSGGQANTASTSVTAPSVTTTVANAMVVGFFGLDNDATFTPPSGMTERWDLDVQGTNDEASEAADVVKATAGATGTKVATATVSDTSIGQLIALKPSGTIAFRSASSSETVPTTTLAINKPAGTAADDVLLAVVSARSDPAISPPAGWARVRSDLNGTSLTQTVFVRTAGGSEPASYTFTLSKPVTAVVGGLIAYSGMDPISPIDTHGGQANASSASVTAPSITTTVADATVVGLFGTGNDATFTQLSGMTERFDILATGTSAVAAAADDAVQASAGPTGTKVATASKSGVNIGQLVALRPAAATVNLGRQTQHTAEDWDLGLGDGLAVNVATRNAIVSHPIVSLPVRGSSVSLALTYNAQDTADVGIGPGWRLNLGRRLYLHADGTVTVIDADGSRHTFTSPSTVGSVTTYSRPATLYATLVKDTSQGIEFALTWKDKSKDTFDISGSEALLIRSEDRFGNGVTLAYSGGNPVTITDTAASRVIDLAWDTSPAPDRLTSITDWAYISGGVVQTTNTGSRRQYRFFYDAAGNLAGWSDPLNSAGSCPTNASHLTCLTYTNNLLTAISKTQTVETFSAGTLGSTTRTITTDIAYAGNLVSTVTDAEEQSQGTPERTTFTAESSTRIRADRPTTTTTYGLVGAGDAYGRVESVWRKLDGTTSLETRTTWDATYPTEPATVTDNYGALLSTPARTMTTTYVASSLGNVLKIVEPLTATDDRWTEFAYNANNDVLTQTVSLEGSGTDRTVTKSCYSADCTTNTGLTLLKRIDNYVSGGTVDEDTNVATEFAYDAYGQLTLETRHNKAFDGSGRDDRATGYTYDGNGNQTTTIANYANGTVTSGDDLTPNATTGARTDLTTASTYDTAGNRVSMADPRRAIAAALTGTIFVRDTFSRSATDGWGTADTGGPYSSTNADFDVNGSIGTINLASATNRNAYLTGVSAADQEVLLKVNVDKLAVGSSTFTWAYLRRQDSSNYYQARIIFDTDQKVRLLFGKTVAGTTTTIVNTATPETHTTTAWYWMRARLSGTTSVNLKARLWRDGSAEPPSWTVDSTDASPPAALQGSGHFGIRFQVGGTGLPVLASYDELSVTTIGGGGVLTDDYVSRSTFDPLNQQLTDKTPTTPGLVIAQKTATTTYDELGLVREAADFGALRTATIYDRAGRSLSSYEDPDPAGSASQTTAMTYDADGKTLTAKDRRQVADATLGSTKIEYDGLGRPTKVIEAFGSSSPDVASETKTEYDGLDRVIASEVGFGTSGSQRTETAYDLGGRATETDDGFACATATYDYRDLGVTRIDGLTGGTCASGTNQRTVTTSIDGLGRAWRSEVTAGVDSGDRPVDLTLDSVGNLLSAAVKKGGATTTSTFTVNLLDQVMTEARADGSTVKATYDPAALPTDRCYWKPAISVGSCFEVGHAGWANPPTSSTTTTYDARNQRVALADSAANSTTTYDPDHNYQPAAYYLPTAAGREQQSLYGYDGRHRLTTITHQLCVVSSGHACSSTTATGSDAYAYDDNDNRTTVNESNGSASSDRRYCYDARNQLVYRNTGAACSSGANDEAYTYDDTGNRLTAAGRSFTYSAEGQLTSCTTPSCTVSYDSAGRTATMTDNGTSWTFEYDAEGRLVKACKSTTCTGSIDKVEFTYDGEGHRTKIVTTPAAGSPVTTTEFRYQGDAVVSEVVGGTVTRDFVVDETGTIRKVIVPAGQTDAGTYLVVWNGHGDATGLWRQNVDGTLTLANSYTYTTWGTPTTATHNAISDLALRYLYVGAAGVQWDNAYGLGFTYMRARHYSPALGRFLQPDPARGDTNSFVYADDNPVSKADPSGLFAECLIPTPWTIAACGIHVGTVLTIGALGIVFAGTAATIKSDTLATSVAVNKAVGTYAEALIMFSLLRYLNYNVRKQVYFWTPYGSRYEDICVYRRSYDPNYRALFCVEVKVGTSRYYLTTQWWKDVWIMARWGFPIYEVRVAGY
jgi:RHS repeat-associated protein